MNLVSRLTHCSTLISREFSPDDAAPDAHAFLFTDTYVGGLGWRAPEVLVLVDVVRGVGSSNCGTTLGPMVSSCKGPLLAPRWGWNI